MSQLEYEQAAKRIERSKKLLDEISKKYGGILDDKEGRECESEFRPEQASQPNRDVSAP
jgi:hypothetical protein